MMLEDNRIAEAERVRAQESLQQSENELRELQAQVEELERENCDVTLTNNLNIDRDPYFRGTG